MFPVSEVAVQKSHVFAVKITLKPEIEPEQAMSVVVPKYPEPLKIQGGVVDGVAVGVIGGVSVGVSEVVTVGVGDAVSVTVCVSVGVCVMEGVSVGVLVGLTQGVKVPALKVILLMGF